MFYKNNASEIYFVQKNITKNSTSEKYNWLQYSRPKSKITASSNLYKEKTVTSDFDIVYSSRGFKNNASEIYFVQKNITKNSTS